MHLAIAEGDLRDAAIQDDDLPDDGVDKVLELQVADMESEAREINAAMPHSVLEQEAGGFLQELLIGHGAGEDGRLLCFGELALQSGDGVLQVTFLSQEVGLVHLIFRVEEEMCEA